MTTTPDRPWTPAWRYQTEDRISMSADDWQVYQEAYDAMYAALGRFTVEPEPEEASWSHAFHECPWCGAGEVPLDEPLPHKPDCPIVEGRAALAQAKDGAR